MGQRINLQRECFTFNIVLTDLACIYLVDYVVRIDPTQDGK